MFYINKVRKGNSDDKTKKWFQSLLQMLNGLRDYTKEYHKTGLTWGVKALGAKACSEYKATGGQSKTSGPPKGGPPPPGPSGPSGPFCPPDPDCACA